MEKKAADIKQTTLSLKSKSLLLLIFWATTLVFTPLASAADQELFNDVHEGDTHFVALKFLKEKNLIQGYEDGSFRPNQTINRAESLQILLKAIPTRLPGDLKNVPTNTNTQDTQEKSQESEQIEKPVEVEDFIDVKKNDWFYENVKDAFTRKIVNGYPDKSFHPEKNIIRAEALKIVLLQAQFPFPHVVEKPPYSDVSIDSWFAVYCQVAKDRGLFLESRKNKEFLPAENMTRAQFAELVYRLLQSNEGIQFARATFYSDALAGRGTSSGDPYHPGVFTTAHKTLPFGTKLLVTNLANGKEIEVKVNDRGPYATGIGLDLSKSAFAAIASVGTGVITTQYKILP